jgi:hypothetical protein
MGMITRKHTCARRCGWVLTSSALILVLLMDPRAFAGPPFQTDDPEPVGFRHYEAYLFGTFDRTGGATFSQVPAVEFNWGAVTNLQIHLIVPGTYLSANGAYGIGDAEFGVKYRFVQESSKCPQVGAIAAVGAKELRAVDILRRGWIPDQSRTWHERFSFCGLAVAAADDEAVDARG